MGSNLRGYDNVFGERNLLSTSADKIQSPPEPIQTKDQPFYLSSEQFSLLPEKCVEWDAIEQPYQESIHETQYIPPESENAHW